MSKKAKRIVGGILAGVVILVELILLCMSLRKVDAGYNGVVYSMNGGIQNETLSQGWHWIKPGQKMYQYTVGIEQSYLTASAEGDSPEDDSFSAPTKDGKGLTCELTFTYRFDQSRLAQTFIEQKGRDGNEVLTIFIKPNVISWTKEITATYPVTEVLGDKRSQLNSDVSAYLHDKFLPYGIIIENASFINITTDPDTQAAINKKVNAQQELELANIESETAKVNAEKDRSVAVIAAEKEKETALIEAERNKEVASINAEKAKIAAEGEAEAIRIKADADAEANRKIAESLTPELIEKIKYEAWNGELPTYQGGDNSAILDLR